MKYQAVVIGTSLGGMEALKIILTSLPRDFSLPILIVQHLSAHSDSFLAKYLDNICEIEVKEADEKERVISGCAYIAPPNYHLMVEKEGHLALSVDEKVNYARPSIDVLFESAADAYRDQLIGVILTGANSDGAWGIRQIKENGGTTIVQEPKTAVSSIMPSAAIKSADIDYIVPLSYIGELLNLLAE
ncbi:chemotaxis protein CheB [Cellulosilyticum sp. I15G10I2]|uniref:chemotaxis protein CheB n=1 Tax=Cellulosilyticum sp. I15G10I2 TaxID=1892843 RepID=UPI00085CCE70|nr:chemotaxis protein CheB [Cellulosilyticum sp. I15G10I2]